MRRKLILILLTYLFVVPTAMSQVLQDYSDSFAKLGSDSWINTEDRYEVVLDLKNFPMSRVSMRIPGPATVFANENVWFLAEKDSSLSIPLSELRGMFPADSLRLMFVANPFRIEELEVKKTLVRNVNSVKLRSAEEAVRQGLLKGKVNNLFYTGLLVILFLTALYRMAYPFLFASMTRPLSLINAEDFSQSGSLQKFFSFDILLYLLIINLALGLMASMGLVLFREMWVSDWIGFDFVNLLGLWTLMSLAFFGLTVIKFLGIRIVAYLFDLGKIAFSHFFYLLRLLVIGSGISLLLLAYFLVNDFLFASEALGYLLQGIFWMYLLAVSILFIIMINRFSFKKYHLFTYLCIAEMVPYLIFAKIIMNLGQ